MRWTVVALIAALGGQAAAQAGIAQLGLTETAARNFLLDEIKGPAGYRRAPIAIAGTRAFLKLPPAARGPAATALFAWAKAYVNTPAFRTSYDTYRKGRLPSGTTATPAIDDVLKKEAAEMAVAMEEMKKNLAGSGLSPAEQAKILAAWKQAQDQAASPEFLAAKRKGLEAERAAASESEANLIAEVERSTPADPQILFARRLREFLEITADVNFSARTISLTGGPDGIELLNKADRQRHWIWQEAAIVGREATTAARAAAEAWLKEIER